MADVKSRGRLLDCRFLLGSLVALIVVFPFLEDVAMPLVLVLPIAVVFLAGVVAVDDDRRHTRRAFVIAAVEVGLTLVSIGGRELAAPHLFNVIALILALLSTAVLILFATYAVLRYILEARVITQDQIYAGISMYIMLGFAFGAIYYLLAALDPSSFVANNQAIVGNDTPDLMYFSFVTLTSLGYGDITPRANLARSLVLLEALSGMLYIAVFMARLVSLHSTRGEND